MRAAILLAIWLGGCDPSEESPPDLPGERPPPCELAEERLFLLDDVRVPDGTEIPVDIDGDGFIDTWNHPHRAVAPATEGRLAAELSDAFSHNAILWVLSTQGCVDTRNEFVRATLRRGVSFDPQMATVTLTDEELAWATGRREDDTITASLGFGSIPVASTVDLEAASSVTDWRPALLVSLQVTGASTVNGTLVAAFDPNSARSAFSGAIARTLTDMKALEPTCPQCSNEAFAILIRAFDTNLDGLFSAAEVETSGYLEFFGLQPTLDLFASFNHKDHYWPGHDGIVDSLGASYVFSAHEVQAN